MTAFFAVPWSFTSIFSRSTLLASCEPDVREFMHQLDLCLTSKQEEWRRKERSYRLQLENKEKEQSSLRIAIEEREKEVNMHCPQFICPMYVLRTSLDIFPA